MSGQDGRDEGVIALHRHGSATAFVDMEKEAVRDRNGRRVRIKADEVQKLSLSVLEISAARAASMFWGLDGLLVLVSPKNPIVSLPTDTIAKIFSGQITDWSRGRPARRQDRCLRTDA